MTKQEFAQQLVLKTLIVRGADLNMSDISSSVLDSAARIAKSAMSMAEAIEKSNSDFFTK